MNNTIIRDSHYLISSIIQDLKTEQNNTYILYSKHHILTDVILELMEARDNLKSLLLEEE